MSALAQGSECCLSGHSLMDSGSSWLPSWKIFEKAPCWADSYAVGCGAARQRSSQGITGQCPTSGMQGPAVSPRHGWLAPLPGITPFRNHPSLVPLFCHVFFMWPIRTRISKALLVFPGHQRHLNLWLGLSISVSGRSWNLVYKHPLHMLAIEFFPSTKHPL